MKILVVDDSPTIRAALKGLLERMGHTVVEANDGKEALQIYRHDPPGLVLIDVVMPIMDGYESSRHMRETKADEWVPIFFLSSKEADQDLDRAIEAGGDDYLVKPVSFVVLNAKIRALHRTEIMRSKLLETSRDLVSANRELEKLSRQDGLTGIANRRYFDSYLLTEVRRAARNRQPLSLILADVDHFKAFNDHYGHQAGDDCLRQVAEALRAAGRRPADLAARYGGEEFALILPGTGLEGAVDVARAVSRAIAGLAIAHARSAVGQNLTLSLGIASLTPEKETSSEDLIHRATRRFTRPSSRGGTATWCSAGNKKPRARRGFVENGSPQDYAAAIAPFIFASAFASIWRMRSAETLNSSASSCSVAGSFSRSQRASTMRRLRASRLARAASRPRALRLSSCFASSPSEGPGERSAR